MLRLPSASIKNLAAALISGLILALLLACEAEPAATSAPALMPPPTATPAPAQPASPTAVAQPTEAPPEAAREGEELGVILATTVLEAGPQRVAFLLTTQTGLVKDAEVSFTPVYVPENAAGDTVTTRFNEWPYGTRGTFAAEVDFDRPGPWRLDISADGPDATGWAAIEIEVGEDSPVPSLGAIGPLSENKTLAGVGDIALLTTDYSPDPGLYEVTIREAVESPLPAVLVFASPAFCTTATCGPQVDAVRNCGRLTTGRLTSSTSKSTTTPTKSRAT